MGLPRATLVTKVDLIIDPVEKPTVLGVARRAGKEKCRTMKRSVEGRKRMVTAWYVVTERHGSAHSFAASPLHMFTLRKFHLRPLEHLRALLGFWKLQKLATLWYDFGTSVYPSRSQRSHWIPN